MYSKKQGDRQLSRFTSIALILLALLISARAGASAGEIGRDIEISRYRVSATISDDCSALDVKSVLTLKNRGALPCSAPAIVLGKGFKGSILDSVACFDGDGKPLKFTFEDNVLRVDLRLIGETQLKICYRLREAAENEKDAYGHFAFQLSPEDCHINAAITRTDCWFPRLQNGPVRALPPFELTIDAPECFEVMASGKLADCSSDGSRKKFLWKSYRDLTDRSLFFFAAKQHKKRVSFADGFSIDLYYPSGSLEENLKSLAETVHRSYSFFEDSFAPSPCREYKMMAFSGGYSGLCNSMTAPVSLFTKPIVNNEMGFPLRTVVHEVSHTWWGNMVVPDPSRDYWLFEGFAKYSEIVALKPVLDIDAEMESFRRLKALSLPYLDCAPSVQQANKASERVLQTVSAYYRGALFLRMIRSVMGAEQFSAGLKDYVLQCRNMTATTDLLRNLLNGRSGRNLREIFAGYLNGRGFAYYTLAGVGGRLNSKEKTITDFVHFSNTGAQPVVCDVEYSSLNGKERGPLFVKKGGGCMFYVVRGIDEMHLPIAIDPDGVFPVCPDGKRGCGGTALYEEGRVRLRDVIRGAPLSRAGIKDGDVLLKIDGRTPPKDDICGLNNLLQRQKGSVMVLTVEGQFGMGKKVPVRF